MAKLLEVKDLATHFFTQDGVVKAVDGISYELEEGETVGIVGESGCGKSVSALSVMRLVASPPGRTVGGEVIFWFPATEAADVWIVEFLVAVRAHAVPLVVLAAVPAVVLSFPERNAARAVLIGDTHRGNSTYTFG